MGEFPKLYPVKKSSGSISSIQSLCKALDITDIELMEALALPTSLRYIQKQVPKKDGSTRIVYKPHYLLRKIQRRINKRIFSDPNIIAWPDHVFGSIPNDRPADPSNIERDYVNCARQHCGAKTVLSLDIKDFFDNIHRDHVVEIFANFFNFSGEVAIALGNICCREQSVVQGALTSSYIATLSLYEKEGNVVKRLRNKNLTYTRFVDDITISSKLTNYNFGYALDLVESMLNEAGLPLNKSKNKIQQASILPLIVHGLRVDFAEPRLPPDEPKRIRASVKNLELLAATPGYRASRAYRRDFNRCMGRVNKLARVKHNQHSVLLNRLRRIAPLASHMDITRAETLISRLQASLARKDYQKSYWFYKRYHVASERLGILKRSFPKTAEHLRDKLQQMRPLYDDD